MAASQRVYKVTKPNMHGADIKAWHQTVIRLFKTMGIVPPLSVNNDYNANTRNVSQALCTAVGLDYKTVFKNGLGPNEREEIKKAAAKKPTAKETKFRGTLKKRKGWKSVPAPKKSTSGSTQGTLNGFDVSHYQPSSIASVCPGDFAVIKATEGLTYVGPTFTTQLSGAKHSGKLVGLYHFADGNDPAHEAQHFYNTVRPYIGQALMVLDFEGPALAHGAAWAKSFLDHFHTLSGIKALIYGSAGNICNSEFAAVAAAYEIWVAAYPSMNPTGYNPKVAFENVAPWKTTRMRQYSSAGRLSGYSGNLDLDVFYGDKDLWRELCKKS